MRKWAFNVLISLDQLWNAIFDGNPDETISSRAGKAMLRGEGWACVLCKLLNTFQADHCLKSIEWDEAE